MDPILVATRPEVTAAAASVSPRLAAAEAEHAAIRTENATLRGLVSDLTAALGAVTSRVAALEARQPTSGVTAAVFSSLLAVNQTRTFDVTLRRELPDLNYDAMATPPVAALGTLVCTAAPLSKSKVRITVRATGVIAAGTEVPLTVFAIPY